MSDTAETGSLEPSAEDVQAALKKIVSSVRFQRSKRACSMLEYIVGETLAGRSAQLKAYSLAIDVFGRDESFNPEADPLVRVQASRLRELLDAYYHGDGANDAVEIRMPRGRYSATFAKRNVNIQLADKPEPLPETLKPAPSVLRRFSLPIGSALAALALVAGFFIYYPIKVEPEPTRITRLTGNDVMPQVAFEVSSTGPLGASYSDFIKLRADGTIAKYGQLYTSKSQADRLVTTGKQPAYLGRIVTSFGDPNAEAHLQIIDFASGTIIFTDDIPIPFRHSYPNFRLLEEEITKTFSQVGPVFHHLQEHPNLSSDLQCVLDTMQILREDEHPEPTVARLIECLHEALERHPKLGIAGVQLAVLLLSEGDRNHLYKGKSAYTEARVILDKVLKVTPNLPGALMVMAMTVFIEGDVETAFEFDRRVVEINPNSPLIQAQQGMHLIRAGRFVEGRQAMQKSIDLSKQPRLLHQSYLYFSMLETDVEGNEVKLANILATQTSAFNGIAAYLANIQLGNKERALKVISTLDNGKFPSVDFLMKTLLDQRFKSAAAQKIIDRVSQTSVWRDQVK